MTEQTQQSTYGESFKYFADRQQDPSRRTALNVQNTSTREGYPTLSVEIAALQGSRADWGNKITLQLTKNELTAFCSVLFGLRKSMEGRFHGDARNKGISAFFNGPKGAAIVLSEKGRQLHSFLPPDDQLELAVFCIRRLAEAWRMTPADAIAMLRQASWMARSAASP